MMCYGFTGRILFGKISNKDFIFVFGQIQFINRLTVDAKLASYLSSSVK
jgi:hypothetical protein